MARYQNRRIKLRFSLTLFILGFLLLVPHAVCANIYYLQGWVVSDECSYENIYGATVEEVGRRFAEMHNAQTVADYASVKCTNRTEFISANEEPLTFANRSVCTRFYYTFSIKKIVAQSFGAPDGCP